MLKKVFHWAETPSKHFFDGSDRAIREIGRNIRSKQTGQSMTKLHNSTSHQVPHRMTIDHESKAAQKPLPHRIKMTQDLD